MTPIRVPTVGVKDRESWLAFAEICERMPDGWTLVGGSLTQLHLLERGSTRARFTRDMDVVLDIRARPKAIPELVETMRAVGYEPGLNPAQKDHRWIRGDAQIDILVPRGLRSSFLETRHDGIGFALETRGAEVALRRSEKRDVQVDGTVFTVNRPDLVGALYGKCSALLIPGDADKSRHFEDIGLLASIVSEEDLAEIRAMRSSERKRIAGSLRRAIDSGDSEPRDLQQMHHVLEWIARAR